MNNTTFCIVLTTINSGDILDGYCRAAVAENLSENVQIIVIPDHKSPTRLYEACQSLRKAGFHIVCPTLQEQELFLDKIGPLKHLIPYNSDNRRNIGFLMALEANCDVLISIDDDNYCIPTGSMYAEYASVILGEQSLQSVNSSNGWFNLCDLLTMEPSCLVYPRGFPYHKRHQTSTISYQEERGTIRLNAGLWLSEPDLDAMTWLVRPARATAFEGHSYMLGDTTWTPINTQNTSLHRDLIVAYYFVRMGYPLAGMPIDRYGDIFSGYLVQACVRHMKHRIRVGTPIADHRRNAHNYMRDMHGEMACILVLEEFTDWLHDAELEGNTYEECYLSLANAIDEQIYRFNGSIWTDGSRGYFHQMTHCMRRWVKAFQIIALGVEQKRIRTN